MYEAWRAPFPTTWRRAAPFRGVFPPLTREYTAKILFAPAAGARGILLAVSGGPDSVALMLLAGQWRKTSATPPIAIATVDHGLRNEAAAEARSVGEWARALGFTHHVLTFDGAKPKSRIQERARALRYDLLAACAQKIGADMLVTAHHADDQAETILFRLTRGSGVAGLAGMARLSAQRGLTLFRPLLDIPKAGLVALCERAGHAYFRDPSNADTTFARPRLRQLGATLADLGLSREALLRLSARAAGADDALRRKALEAAAKLDWRLEKTKRSADLLPLADEPGEIVLRVLAGALGGGDEVLRLERLETLACGLLAALQVRKPFASTLAGWVVRLTKTGMLTLSREPQRRRGARLRDAANSP